jgi:hypothetical protein
MANRVGWGGVGVFRVKRGVQNTDNTRLDAILVRERNEIFQKTCFVIFKDQQQACISCKCTFVKMSEKMETVFIKVFKYPVEI